MSIDWSTAPEGAEFYADTKFRKLWQVWSERDKVWNPSVRKLHHLQEYEDYEENPESQPAQWPAESRIEQIGQNGGDGLHYDEERESHYAKSGAREQKLMEQLVAECKGIAEKPIKPEQEEPAPLRKYDRRIKGKYNTGTCTVDVYRVLSAFEITEPELQHCIKKLLAAGQRGAKDYNQDLREASVSLCMLIDRLAE